MNARQLVAVLLDEGRDWSEMSQLLGRDVWELPADVKRALAKQGEETAAKEEPFSGTDKDKAKQYFIHPPKKPSLAMQQFKSGIKDWKVLKTTQPEVKSKTTQPSLVIRGATKFVPKHLFKPKSWEIW